MAATAAPPRPSDQGAATKPATEIPGPPGPGFLQTLLGVMRPITTRVSARRRYGPLYQTNDAIIGQTFHIADRDLIEQIFKWKPDQYRVGEPRAIMEPVTGRSSVLLLDGAEHLRHRKLMLPPFHGEAITRYSEVIEEIANREIDGWREGQTIQTRAVAQAITIEVIIRAVFGITDPARIAELKDLLPRISSPSPFLLLAQKDLGPRSPWGRFVRIRDRVDELLYEEIGQRRAADDGDGRDDVMTLLLAARDEDGEPLTDRELRDELITILIAGYETTATSIGWAFERLLRTPSALSRLTREVHAREGDEYLEAVIKETLRVRPVVSEVFRAPTERTELGGYVFEPGAQLAVAILTIQFDPELYAPDPEAFRPERFLEGAPEPYTWVPFGGGVRRCLGAAFAQLEMRIVIATILRRAVLRAPRAADEKARFRGVTLLPARGGQAIVDEFRETGKS